MFNLIPTLMAVMIALAMMPVAVHWMNAGFRKTKAYSAGSQAVAIINAIKAYVKDNYNTIVTATAGGPKTIALSALQASGYLSTATSTVNPYGQQWSMAIYQPSPGVLEVLATTSGGAPIEQKTLPSIAVQIGRAGGFQPYTTGPYAASAGDAVGSFGGWKVPVSDFGLKPSPGHLAAFLHYKNGAQSSDYLYRVQVPGQSQLNTMQTALNLGGNDISNANLVSAHTVQVAGSTGGQFESDQGGSLELGAANGVVGYGTPYIDFHGNGSGTDNNVRIINNASGTLSVYADPEASGTYAGLYVPNANGKLGSIGAGNDLRAGINTTSGFWANSSGNTWISSLFERGVGYYKGVSGLGAGCSIPSGWSAELGADSAGDFLKCKGGTWQSLGGGGSDQLITKSNFTGIFGGHTASDPRTGALMFYVAPDGTLFDAPSVSGNTVTWTHTECNLLQTGQCVPGDVAAWNNNRDYWASLGGISWTVTWGASTDESTREFARWDDPTRATNCGWHSTLTGVNWFTWKLLPKGQTLPSPPWVNEGTDRYDNADNIWVQGTYSYRYTCTFQ